MPHGSLDDCFRNSATVTVTPFWLVGFNVRAIVLSYELEISLLADHRPSPSNSNSCSAQYTGINVYIAHVLPAAKF